MFQGWYANLHGGAANRVFQAEFEVVLQVGALANSRAPPATAKDITEDVTEGIAETTTTTTSRLLDPGMAELIVSRAFIGTGQDFEGFFGFLELGFGFRVVRIAIRMMFHRQTSERLFELGVRRAV